MALSFPLPLADFADTLGISSVKWSLQDNRELSGMGSGQILQADLAPQIWKGDVTLSEKYHYDARKIEAKINAVVRSMGTFYLYDPRTAAPYADRDGSILGSSTVTIASLPSSKAMTLKGLPAGYVLTEGDYLAFDYGNPARRAFHEVAEGVTAGGTGVTPAFEVSPFIRPGAAIDAVVTLIKSSMKCMIVPGSFSGGQSTEHVVTTQLSFSVVQKP